MSNVIQTLTPRKPVSVEIGGATHHGHYQTENRMIRVEYRSSSKATQLGGSPPGVLARLILAELVREAPRGIASGKFALANAEIGASTWNLLPPKAFVLANSAVRT